MLENRLPLLVTGIAGVAGFNAFLTLQAKYPGQVIGIRPHKTWKLTGPGIVPLDADDIEGMRQFFDQFGFRSVLDTLGNCALKSCELDPKLARIINVDSALVVAENACRHGARLVHLSSDLVYSGDGSGNYVETDPVDPVTIYGKNMAEAERSISQVYPSAAILRISLPMGASFNRHAGAIDWIQSRFRAGRPATLYFDEVRSCTYCPDLTRVFESFLVNDEAGIFHCGGPRPMTLYQIAQVVNRVGGYDPDLLKGCPRLEAGPMPPRAGNVSMDSTKLRRALGGEPFAPWPLEPELVPVDRNWHYDRPSDERHSPREIVERLYHLPSPAKSAHKCAVSGLANN